MAHIAKGLLLATALTGVSAAASAQTVGPLVRAVSGDIFAGCTADNVPSQVSGRAYANSLIEPFIALNPTAPGNLLIGVQQDRWSDGGARGLRGAVSGDAGASWSLSLPGGVSQCSGGAYQRATDAWVTFGPDGVGYFSSLAFDNPTAANPNGDSAVLNSRSVDGGASWEAAIPVIADTDPLAFNDKNSITADPTKAGYVYSVWDRLYGPPGAFRAPGGSDEGGGSYQAQAAAAHDGVAQAKAAVARKQAFAKAQAFDPNETFGPSYMARSVDGGRSWERAVPIYDPGVNAQTISNIVQVLPNGDVLDFFDVINDQGIPAVGYVRSVDHGFSFETTAHVVNTLDTNGGGGAVTPNAQIVLRDAAILFSVAVNKTTGAIYLAWEDNRFGAPYAGGTQQIMNTVFSQSTDGGRTWTQAVRIDKTPANAARPLLQQSFNPTIAVADDGTLAVSYYDFRNDQAKVGVEATDVWMVFCKPAARNPRSCDEGHAWGREVRLTDSPFNIKLAPVSAGHRGLFLGDYFSMVAQGTSFWPAFVTVTGPRQTAVFTRRVDVGSSVVGSR